MNEHPILFSGPMVLAILGGRKTQTRRIMKPQPHGTPSSWDNWYPSSHKGLERNHACFAPNDPTRSPFAIRCPHGGIGDQLWVRETLHYDWQERCWRYAADGEVPPVQLEDPRPDRWPRGCCPSIHMPRQLCRITLKITGIRVERLTDISEEDAKAEGLKCLSKDGGRTYKYGIPDRDGWPGTDDYGWSWEKWDISPRVAFAELWDQINGPASFNRDPWVWVIEFKERKEA